MCCCTRKSAKPSWSESGQATVEAAFLIPTLCFAIAILLQPAVLLYDRCVMEAAAMETCRLAATSTCSDDAIKGFVKRRMAALPDIAIFHSKSCDWKIEIIRGSADSPARVKIENHVKMLPLLGISSSTITHPAQDGCGMLQVEATSTVFPSWLGTESGTPEDWIDRWE